MRRRPRMRDRGISTMNFLFQYRIVGRVAWELDHWILSRNRSLLLCWRIQERRLQGGQRGEGWTSHPQLLRLRENQKGEKRRGKAMLPPSPRLQLSHCTARPLRPLLPSHNRIPVHDFIPPSPPSLPLQYPPHHPQPSPPKTPPSSPSIPQQTRLQLPQPHKPSKEILSSPEARLGSLQVTASGKVTRGAISTSLFLRIRGRSFGGILWGDEVFKHPDSYLHILLVIPNEIMLSLYSYCESPCLERCQAGYECFSCGGYSFYSWSAGGYISYQRRSRKWSKQLITRFPISFGH